MRISISTVTSIALILLVTACSKSQEVFQAPRSQADTGVIIQGSAPEVNAVLSQSSEHRVLNATHGLYEVKGLSLEQVRALAPQLSAENNQYFESLISAKAERKHPHIEDAYAKLAMNDEVEETENPEEQTPAVTPQVPPALQGCDMSIAEKPMVVLDINNDVLKKSLTMNLSETPGFTSAGSLPHPTNPDSELEFRWEVLAPSLSSLPSEATVGSTYEFTPDSVGHYRIVLVAKDDKNACDYFIGNFFVTHNPEVNFARSDEEKPSIDTSLFNHLAKVEAVKSWEKATGKGVVVAVLDTGLEYNHPGIKFNLAINESERTGNQGEDSDNNEFKDDVIGWDFANGDNMPFDDEGHGSHVAGLSSSHLIGLAKDSKVMPIKVLNAAGGGDVASIVAGIYYAVDNGAQVINASLGSQLPQFKVIEEAVQYANKKGVTFVAAAGNESLDLSEEGVDVWPAEFNQSNIITVGATGFDDALTSYSNSGKDQVDVAAPGGDGQDPIYSLATMNTHDVSFVASGGTSMAAPIVAGMIAQMLELDPTLTPERIKSILMESGKDVDALAPLVGSGKLLQAPAILDFLSKPLS